MRPRSHHTTRNEDWDGADASIITSKGNHWLKAFRAGLQGSGPAANEPIAVEGPKLIDDALRAGLEAEALLVSESGEPAAQRILLAASATEYGISPSRILRTTDKLFAAGAGTETPQGVAALFRQPSTDFDRILGDGVLTLVVVLVGVQDPGNVGTAIRSAEAFGATGAIAARGTADPWSPKAVRASAGSALRLPTLRGLSIPVLLSQLRASKVSIVAATSDGAVSDRAGAYLLGPAAIFIGSEGSGLPAEVIKTADATMAIPMTGRVESLNAGVAASVLLYETARQRSAARA
ncbi:MAG: RNA methyltransferase [Candidatus Acidiferrales bacterium]